MKAKKTSPKSIRFNINDFEAGMLKGNFESAQEMVDFLLKNYLEGENVQFIKQKTGQIDVQKSVQNVTNIQKNETDVPIQKELSISELFKLMKDGKM
jgi:hypothetical protein